MKYLGSCHCQGVIFEVDAPSELQTLECNCSICRKSGLLHLIVPKSKFTLLSGAGLLSSYRFGTGVANHTFCKICGVKPFYMPRSNPDGVSVNARCLDTPTASLQVTSFDGENWEQHADSLLHLSQESKE